MIDSRIEIYKNGKLLCLCASKDWQTFLPRVDGSCFRWARSPYAEHYKWTWLWATP